MARGRQILQPLVTRIAALMRAHGLNQAALSRALNVRPQEISNLFTGQKKHPSLDFLDQIARVFDYTLADLLAKDLPPASLTPDEKQLLVRYRATKDVLKRHAALSCLDLPRTHKPDKHR